MNLQMNELRIFLSYISTRLRSTIRTVVGCSSSAHVVPTFTYLFRKLARTGFEPHFPEFGSKCSTAVLQQWPKDFCFFKIFFYLKLLYRWPPRPLWTFVHRYKSMREADQQVWNRQLMDSYLLAQVVSCCVQETISGQSYKHSTIVIYDPRVVIWGIFKSGTNLES